MLKSSNTNCLRNYLDYCFIESIAVVGIKFAAVVAVNFLPAGIVGVLLTI